MHKHSPGSLLRRVYAGNFFYGLHVAITTYVISTFLAGYISANYLGLFYAVTALAAICLSLNLPCIIRRLGHFRLAITLISILGAACFGLTLAHTAFPALSLLALYLTAEFLLFITTDLFAEKFSTDRVTGNIRGIYLTMFNLAFIAGPIIAAIAIGEDNFSMLFFVAACAILPMLVIYLLGLRHTPRIVPKEHDLRGILKTFKGSVAIRRIYISSFLLEFFYTWMTIYTPLYLHQTVGLSWANIGVIFTIMLLPFALFELPLGIIADKYLGEQEILASGFIVSAIATAEIYFVGSKSIAAFAGLLFLTRVGAAAIEIMNDSYFFKHVSANNAGVVALFRTARQVNYIVAPLVAVALLVVLPMRSLFLVLGAVMILGSVNASKLVDTKPSAL